MKKYKIILIFTFILSSISFNLAHATSGACSWHGGVNCSAYSPINGNAICNDGADSGVAYSFMSECSPNATHPYLTCSASCSLDAIQSQCDDQKAVARGISVTSGLSGSPMASTQQNEIDTDCQNKKRACEIEINGYNSCVSLNNQRFEQQNQLINQRALITKKASCNAQGGENYNYDSNSNSCKCDKYYWLEGGSCVFSVLSCAQKFGQNSKPVYDNSGNNTCQCVDGYSFDSAGKCVSNTKPSEVSFSQLLDKNSSLIKETNNKSGFIPEKKEVDSPSVKPEKNIEATTTSTSSVKNELNINSNTQLKVSFWGKIFNFMKSIFK